VLVALGALASTAALWQALEFQQTAQMRDRIERRVDGARHDLERELAALVPVLSPLAAAGPGEAGDGWRREAALRFHERADIVALAQLRPDGTPRHLLARPERTDVDVQRLADASVRMWLASLPPNGPGVLAADGRTEGAPALLVAVPVSAPRPDAAGWTLALCDLRELARRALMPYDRLGVALQVEDQSGGLVYRNRVAPAAAVRPHSSTLAIGTSGRRITVTGRATAALVADATSTLPAVVLLLGSALACALGVVVALGQRAVGRSADAQRTTQQLLEALVDRNIAREALERREALLQTVLETMGEGVIAASASGEFLVFNRAARELLGIDGDDGLHALEWADLVVAAEPGVWPTTDQALERALRGERIDDLDICLRRADGREPRWVSVFARPLALPFGLTGSMLVLRDVTERRLAQERLTETARELERSNRELTEFASVASHDLRAPLRSIRSFVELLSEDYGASFNEDGREFVTRIRAAVTRMTSLIDGLLALARVRAKGEPFSPVDLGEVAREVIADLAGPIAESGAIVRVEALPTVDADRLQMRQLLQNLVANAIKFRQAGVAPEVRLSARPTGGHDPEGAWELHVRDNGIGLDAAGAERIFRPFERLHGHSAFEGSGLGLAVCARIVERHGGTIRVEAAPGRGATFIVRLPAERRHLEAA
jgi:PAS domain S-box-containing protein